MIEKILNLLSEAEKDLVYAKAKIEVYNAVLDIAKQERYAMENAPMEETIAVEEEIAEACDEPQYSVSGICPNSVNI